MFGGWQERILLNEKRLCMSHSIKMMIAISRNCLSFTKYLFFCFMKLLQYKWLWRLIVEQNEDKDESIHILKNIFSLHLRVRWSFIIHLFYSHIVHKLNSVFASFCYKFWIHFYFDENFNFYILENNLVENAEKQKEQ